MQSPIEQQVQIIYIYIRTLPREGQEREYARSHLPSDPVVFLTKRQFYETIELPITLLFHYWRQGITVAPDSHSVPVENTHRTVLERARTVCVCHTVA